jgi:hypothetical protein
MRLFVFKLIKRIMEEHPIEISTAVNKIFILASLQEDIMMQTPQLLMKHEIKHRFNKIFTEIKKLNKLVNSNMSEEELEGFDLIAEEINSLFKKLEE